jgi:hypothetical protein
MALATRPKPKSQHRKRAAQHHRQNKHYLKTYWPYLPLFAIIGGGVALNKAWYSSGYFSEKAADLSTTRVEALTGSTWSAIIVALLATAAMAVFLFRYGYRVQRVMNRGEAFVVHHPWIDVALVFVVTAGVLLSRSVLP